MRQSFKPAGNCYTCRLNLGDHCWLYKYPRGQWRGGRRCRAFENETVYASFSAWQKLPSVKTRKELRGEFFRTRKRSELYHDPVPAADRHERKRMARGG